MVYSWKFPGLYPVSAQTAGEECERIVNEYGKLTPGLLVEESRNEKAPLHSCFEWNDQTAAEKYREKQAANIIRAVVTVAEREKDNAPATVRAYVHTKDEDYQSIRVVMERPDLRKELMASAMRDMLAFKSKYDILSELKPVFSAIDVVVSSVPKRERNTETKPEFGYAAV